MAKTYNKMRLDVSGGLNGIVTEVQGDQNSRYLDIYLFNNGIPIDLTGHTVRIYMRRPNTNPLEEFFNDGEITEATRGRCQFLLSTQALAKVGELEAQVSIWNGTEEILSTQVFKIMVTTNLRTNGSVESSNEYGALVVLFQNLYEAHDLMTTMVQNIGNPSDIAAQYNLATMWQAWEFLTDYMKTDLTNMIEQALANASVQGVLDKIGATADTGGSDTSGTVMGKLNVLVNDKHVKNCIASNTVRESVCSNMRISNVTPGGSGGQYTKKGITKVGVFVPPVDGTVMVDYSVACAVVNTSSSSYSSYFSFSVYCPLTGSINFDLLQASVGDVVNLAPDNASTIFQDYKKNGSSNTNTTLYLSGKQIIEVKKNIPILFFAQSQKSDYDVTRTDTTVERINICYDIV